MEQIISRGDNLTDRGFLCVISKRETAWQMDFFMMAKPRANISAVADWFINHVDHASGETITHLKLQKLLYFSQAWFLANVGSPLFSEDFQAWTHGPVARSIYERFRGQGWDPIGPVEQDPKLSEGIEGFLKQVLDNYGKFGAKYLEQLTHGDAPWIEARGGLPDEARCETVISKVAMREFYGKKIGKNWGSAEV